MHTNSSSYQLDWNSSFEVGHERIDFEHQIFLGLIKKLAETEKSSEDTFARYLIELRKYAEFHFVSEENIMLDCDYPDYEIHHSHHIDLLQKFDDNYNRYKKQGLEEGEFVAFLYEWFVHHTVIEDLRLSEYVKNTN